MARPKFASAPARLDVSRMQDYPGHQIFKEEGKNTVIAFMGQLYSISGSQLPHDPKELVKRKATLTKEMANVFLNKEVKETEACTSGCGFKKVPRGMKFCGNCGAAQTTIQSVSDTDTLVSFLQAVSPDNPFALIDITAEKNIPRARREDFMRPEDVRRIVQDEFANKGLIQQAAVPGEAPTTLNPSFNQNPFGQVSYSAAG